jgi:hypothetical protein
VWDHALGVMKEQGTWAWELKPLLDEYVFALRAAEATRDGFGWLDALERYAENADELPEIAWSVLREVAGSLPTQWDRHTKRAAGLADKLVLTPEAKRRHGVYDEADEVDEEGFDALDGDNVTPIRPHREAS